MSHHFPGDDRNDLRGYIALVRPESKFAGRKLTADEIEAEMGAAR